MTSNINEGALIIKKLNKDLQEKDHLINDLKEKTRYYVTKMKEDHAIKFSELDQRLILKDKFIENNKASFEECEEKLKLSQIKVSSSQHEIALLEISKKELKEHVELLKMDNIELIQSNNIIITNLKEQILLITQDSLKLSNSKELFEIEINELKQYSQDLENKLQITNSQYKILEQEFSNKNNPIDNIAILNINLIEEKDKYSKLETELIKLVERNDIQTETIRKLEIISKNENQPLNDDDENKKILDKSKLNLNLLFFIKDIF
jgi:hypothetical protein